MPRAEHADHPGDRDQDLPGATPLQVGDLVGLLTDRHAAAGHQVPPPGRDLTRQRHARPEHRLPALQR